MFEIISFNIFGNCDNYFFYLKQQISYKTDLKITFLGIKKKISDEPFKLGFKNIFFFYKS